VAGVSPSDEDQQLDSDTSEDEPKAGRQGVVYATIAGVMVLAVVGVAIYLLTSGDDSPTPAADQDRQTSQPVSPTQSQPTTPSETGIAPGEPPPSGGDEAAVAEIADVATQAATAISNADIALINQLSCDPSANGTEAQFPPDAKAEVAGPPEVTGDTATVQLKLTIGDSEPTTVPMPLTKQDGRWCVP